MNPCPGCGADLDRDQPHDKGCPHVPKAKRHPNPLESFDPRLIKMLLAGAARRIVYSTDQYPVKVLRKLNLRLNTIRRKQLVENPDLGKLLYRTSVRWVPSEGRLYVEPRDYDLDDILADATGEKAEAVTVPSSLPSRLADEINALAEDFPFEDPNQ